MPFPAYAASKAALESLCRQSAVEGAPKVRTNLLHPGSDRHLARPAGLQRAAPRDQVQDPGAADREPPGRSPYGALFLLSDESSYVTGQSLVVDGGLTRGPRGLMADDPRIPPLPPEEWSGEQKPILEAIPQRGQRAASGTTTSSRPSRSTPTSSGPGCPSAVSCSRPASCPGATASCSSCGPQFAATPRTNGDSTCGSRSTEASSARRSTVCSTVPTPTAGRRTRRPCCGRPTSSTRTLAISDVDLDGAGGDLRQRAADGGDDGRRPLPHARRSP